MGTHDDLVTALDGSCRRSTAEVTTAEIAVVAPTASFADSTAATMGVIERSLYTTVQIANSLTGGQRGGLSSITTSPMRRREEIALASPPLRRSGLLYRMQPIRVPYLLPIHLPPGPSR